jgi:transcriptional regulator with XRE-family HTH domain
VDTATATSGLARLDGALGGIYWGDNVVWEPEGGTSVEPFYAAIAEEAGTYATAAYVTIEEPPTVIRRRYPSLEVVDARPGSDLGRPRPLLDEMRRRCAGSQRDLLLFDPLETMGLNWGEEMARRFFMRCCPLLLELGAVAYWSLGPAAVSAAVRREVEEVTQCVLGLTESRLRITKAEGRAPSVAGTVFRYQVEAGRPVLESAPAATRLGAALRAVRLERGLAQTELARLAGVSASAVSQAERGQRGFSLETLVELTDRLGITLDDLLRGEAHPGYRLARRDEPRRADGRPAPLVDNPNVGLRAYVARIPPGGSGSPAQPHKGVELVAVGSGLVQVLLSSGRPVLREGEALLAERSIVRGWRNLGEQEATVFWVLRDEAAPKAAGVAEPEP